MKTLRFEAVFCPPCRHILDAASHAEVQGPRAGDIGICCYCGAAHIFEEGGSVHAMTVEERGALTWEECCEMDAVLRAYAAIGCLPRGAREMAKA